MADHTYPQPLASMLGGFFLRAMRTWRQRAFRNGDHGLDGLAEPLKGVLAFLHLSVWLATHGDRISLPVAGRAFAVAAVNA